MRKIIVSVIITAAVSHAMAAQSVHSAFQKASTGEIRVEGWMKETLDAQRNGLTGHIKVAGHPFDKECWGSTEKQGNWRWEDFEQTGYWADGALRLGYLTGDEAMKSKVKKWIYNQIDNPGEDGFIGPELANLWPHVVFFRAIIAEYEASRDKRIVTALAKHYRNAERCRLLIKTDGYDWDFNERTMLHIEMLCWLYNETGDRFFLDKAEDTYRIFCSQDGPFTMQSFASEDVPIVHSVSSCETLKIPVLLYMSTGRREYLETALHGLKKVFAYHGLADGVPSGNEAHDWNKPNGVHETCAISDALWMLGYFLQATGDARFADMMERIGFNAAMGVVSKDFKSLQYYSSPNQVIAKENSSPCTFVGGLDRMAYKVAHGPACCNGNMTRMLPLFCSSQWMRKGPDGIVAALYSPSTFTTTIGKKTVSIKEETSYPFNGSIRFTVNVNRPEEFSLWFRIPQWAENAGAIINGEERIALPVRGMFAEIRRTFKDGDTIELTLPMKVKLTSMPYNGISAERGPLLFALPVEAENRIVETREDGDVEFHSVFMTPKCKWNYGFNPSSPITVSDSGNFSEPWDADKTPVKLHVNASEILNWQLYRGVFTPDMPSILNIGPRKTIELVPMGCTMLRVSVFPDTSRIPTME